MSKEKKKIISAKNVGRIIVYGVIFIFILWAFSYPLGPSKIEANEGLAATSLKRLNGMFATWKKKGYSYTGKRYPHALPNADGMGSTNAGKYSGLYFGFNSAGEELSLINSSEALADFRADGDTDLNEDNGYYYAAFCIAATPDFHRSREFSCKPQCGYWFGLMNFFSSGGKLIPYDLDYARDHYALVAFPADYGSSGEYTFIINEQGTVYRKDFGDKIGYYDRYPGLDPTKYGWEKVKVKDPFKEYNN